MLLTATPPGRVRTASRHRSTGRLAAGGVFLVDGGDPL
jgi:hypothetical protein